MANERPRRAVDEEKHGLRKRIATLEEVNTNLRRENEKVNSELRQFSNDLLSMTADRDNWRKQALEENSRLEGTLQRLRKYLDASEEEEHRSKAHMDAFNEKQAAFKELVDFALIAVEVAAK